MSTMATSTATNARHARRSSRSKQTSRTKNRYPRAGGAGRLRRLLGPGGPEADDGAQAGAGAGENAIFKKYLSGPEQAGECVDARANSRLTHQAEIWDGLTQTSPHELQAARVAECRSAAGARRYDKKARHGFDREVPADDARPPPPPPRKHARVSGGFGSSAPPTTRCPCPCDCLFLSRKSGAPATALRSVAASRREQNFDWLISFTACDGPPQSSCLKDMASFCEGRPANLPKAIGLAREVPKTR